MNTGVKLWDNPNKPRVDPHTRGVGNAVVFLRGVDPQRARPWDHPPVCVEQADYRIEIRQGQAHSAYGFVRRGERVEMVSTQEAFHSLHAGGAAFFTLAFPDPNEPCSRHLNEKGVAELTSAAGYFWMRGYLFVDDHPYYTPHRRRRPIHPRPGAARPVRGGLLGAELGAGAARARPGNRPDHAADFPPAGGTDPAGDAGARRDPRSRLHPLDDGFPRIASPRSAKTSRRMPELPDIVVYIERLRPRIEGQRLEKRPPGQPVPAAHGRAAVTEAEGQTVLGLCRLGKRIVFALEADLFLVLHLMIAGRLHWKPRGAKPPGKIGLAAFDFPSGTLTLTEAGSKKRARCTWCAAKRPWPRTTRAAWKCWTPTRPSFRAALRPREPHAQACADRPAAVQRHRQRLLRRNPAPRPACRRWP